MKSESKKYLGFALLLQILPLFVLIAIGLTKINWDWLQVDLRLFAIITAIGMYEVLVGMLIWAGFNKK
jgi:hypothetical protein